MPVLTTLEEPNLWISICKEFQEKKNILADQKKKEKDVLINFDPAKYSPIFYEQAYLKVDVDDPSHLGDFDPRISHPACFGYSIQKYIPTVEPPPIPPKLPDKKKCTERQYIEHFIFPSLLVALEAMLKAARQYKCFERKRTAFNACDFITEYLYNNNPFCDEESKEERKSTNLWSIPFVKAWNDLHPRPPLPKSLIWTEEEAAIKIQAFYRGYLVRRDPEVQELRQWQRELREENRNINERVDQFWETTRNQSSGTRKTASAHFAPV